MKDSKKKKNKLISLISIWLPVFLWALVIFNFSSTSSLKASNFFVWDFISKKIAHLFIYSVLFTLIFRATKKNWVLTFILTMSYAISDEFHQHFVIGRNASALDLGFDLSGANIAAYTIWKLRQIRQGKHKK